MSTRRALLLVGLVAASVVAGGCGTDEGLVERREEVAKRGALVMPFDLERTTHVFEPTSYGGIQTVVADDPEDQEQIRLIRAHLEKEAEAFARGDFSDPASIHGPEMPGLAELADGYRNIDVELEDIDAGALIRYTSDDRELVDALHAWFEAQVSDHGEHAEHE